MRNKKRLQKNRTVFSPDDIGHKREESSLWKARGPVYEIADTSLMSNEMPDTSVQAGSDSEIESSDDGSSDDV